jgi:hypothetical protein
MHGLVNQGIEDLATHLGGEQLWHRIKTVAGVDTEAFVGMDLYPDELTVRLVQAAATVLELSVPEVLHAFGRHWIRYTARKGYGAIFDTMGASLPEFLGNVNAMHARLTMILPGIQPPSLLCEELGAGRLLVRYWSPRPGLAPMVPGLLHGLGEIFALSVRVTHTRERADDVEHDEFLVEYAPVAVAVAD